MNLKEIRAHARESLKGNWGIAILASIIATTFSAVGGGSTSSSSKDSIDFSKLGELTSTEILTTIAVFGGFVLLSLVLSVVITSLVSIGYAQFNVDLISGEKPKIATIFSKGKQVGTSIVANLLVFIRVFFGTILFIIPGVIASFKYAMVNYVIAENPGITARQALEKSEEIMYCNKFRFFRLCLSFLGWSIVVVLTLGIAGIWVAPYMQAAFATFYKEVSTEMA